jgi:hypothetical protein
VTAEAGDSADPGNAPAERETATDRNASESSRPPVLRRAAANASALQAAEEGGQDSAMDPDRRGLRRL